MSRNRAERRHHRNRVIQNRICIRNIQGSPVGIPGKLDKFNLVCSCEMCGQHTERKLGKKRERQAAKIEIRKIMRGEV